MEPLFVVRYAVTKDIFLEFTKAHYRLKASLRLLWIIPAVFTAMTLYLWALQLFLFPGALKMERLILLSLLITLMWITVAVWPFIAVKRMIKNPAVGYACQTEMMFYPLEFIERTTRIELRTSYALLHHIVETDRLLLLYQNANWANIVKKDAFIQGTPEELVRFLQSVTNIPYDRIR